MYSNRTVFLMADDDADDRMLTGQALRASFPKVEFRTVNDGEELMAYLRRTGPYAPPADAPFPHLLLLDLNMPRLNGHEALEQIKADPALRHLPVVVFTTSEADEDVVRSYAHGVSAFVTKPLTFDALVRAVEGMGGFYAGLAALPDRGRHRSR